ncbi:MAG: MipA/OmpV family protein, partial [Sphingopyxis sp.]|nr:MipA/OmpV family protein [Sphingopyxis sp.]
SVPKLSRLAFFACAPLACATPAFAQDVPPLLEPPVSASQGPPGQPNVFAGDHLTLGFGAGYRPSYEGSDDYLLNPAPLLRGSFGGIDFEARGPGLALDLIPDAPRAKVDFLAGPAFRVNLNRVNQIKDPVVRLLGERDAAIEGGGFAGVSINGVTNPFDSLSFRIDVLTDLGDVHNGTLFSPSVGFSTPLSRAIFAAVSVDATHASGNYMRSEFGVTPAGALASGLPVFTPGSGWKSAGASIVLGYDLSGNGLDGGWGLFGLTSYNRLLNDAARSPIVRLRGDRDQWFLAAGVSYTF